MDRHEIIDKLIRKSFMTGSMAFLVPDDNSDIDYVIKLSDWEELGGFDLCYPGDGDYEIEDYQEMGVRYSVKFRSGHDEINFIVIGDEKEYKNWFRATKLIKDYSRSHPDTFRFLIQDKETRVDLFKIFKEILRGRK